MKISIISASHRLNSQSKKISVFLQINLFKMDSELDTFILDLSDAALPLWSPEKKDGKGVPKADQKKTPKGTAVNALDMKGASLFGGNIQKR